MQLYKAFVFTKKGKERTSAAAKIFFTDSEISGPIPSPGIKVTDDALKK